MDSDRLFQKPLGFWLDAFIALLVIASAASIFLGYLVPQWYSFFTSKVFIFTNGWDEEWYLSWQGIEGFKNIVGTYALYLPWLLQKMGISAAVQNLLFDTLLPPSTALLVFLSLRKCALPVVTALGYSALICFGSVLFNASNPHVNSQLGEIRIATVWLMAGWEVYPSILRTPNPEFSLFLIAAAVYGYVRFSKWWILFLPFPLLYYFTAVPYGFVLIASFSYFQLRSRLSSDWLAALVAALVAFFLSGLGLVVLSILMGIYDPGALIRKVPYLFSETRRPQFPIGTIALGIIFVVGNGARILRLEQRWFIAILILGFASLGAVNLHLFTGYMLSQKNYYDYGLSVIFSISVIVGIQAIRLEILRQAVLVWILIYVSQLNYQSQKIWLGQAEKYTAEISSEIDRIRADPLRAIIPNWNAAGRVAYSTPQLVSPISYMYWYAITQCAGFHAWAASAADFERAHLAAGSRELAESLYVVEFAFDAEKRLNKFPSDLPYCASLDLSNKDFYVVSPK